MSVWSWLTGREKASPWRPPMFIWRSLTGEETEPFTLYGPRDTAQIVDKDDRILLGQNAEPFLKVSYEKGAYVIEQLAPMLTLDGATAEWAAKRKVSA